MPEKQKIQLHDSWLKHLKAEFDQPYMQQLRAFITAQRSAGEIIYPPASQVFNALNSTHFDKVRAVIIGQDPYHGPGQAHGLCFSVAKGVQTPPSLKNIFKEINADLGLPIPAHGCLQSWADQGVLLLNAVLTVQKKQAGSHANKGWEQFTDSVIQALSEQRKGLVFLLWGSYAQKKGQFIDANRHLVLKSVHPSPLSAHRGFIGCKHFSKANSYLKSHGVSEIDWSID
jgi:uracil-DNA glycosylase